MVNEKDSISYKEDTGEVIDNSTCSSGQRQGGQGQVIFRTMWFNPYGIKSFDLSNEYEEIFEEVPPFTVDVETGKLLNDTNQPKLISKGFVNVNERIQSYAKECDIYSILERFAASGDTSLINARDCQFGDVSDIPRNLNDIALYTKSLLNNLDNINPELAKMIMDSNVSPADIEKKANDIYQSRIDEFNKANNVNDDIKKEENN